jgi:hypothetical protein
MSLLYYFDRFTAWLDFSWLVTRPNKAPIYSPSTTNLPPTYVCEIGECEPAEYEPAEYNPGEEKHIKEKPKEEKPVEEKSK